MTKPATHLKFFAVLSNLFSAPLAKCQFSAPIWRPYADSNRGLSRERATRNFFSRSLANSFSSEAPWISS